MLVVVDVVADVVKQRRVGESLAVVGRTAESFADRESNSRSASFCTCCACGSS